MSACISSRGEYSEHEMDETGFACLHCGFDDIEAMCARIAQLEAAVEERSGWRPPARKITTAEELQALVAPSVVLDRFGVAWQSASQSDGRTLWFADGHEPRVAAKFFDPYVFERDRLCGPIAVLHTPEEASDVE